MRDMAELTPLGFFPTDIAALSGRVWEWGPLGGGAYARHVRLLPDGRVAGNLSSNESCWRLRDGGLVFLDRFDIRSAVFESAYADPDGRWVLVAHSHAPGGQPHSLREVPPIAALAGAGVDPVLRGSGPRRPYLVIVRAGEHSLHTRWARTVSSEDRSWDLCVSWYGDPAALPLDDDADLHVLQPGLRKYQALHALLHEASPLWAYDYIALPDDDLMLSWRDWNETFATCREYRLDLAQPALSPTGFVTHPITARDKRHALRYVSFVESMIPVFSREAMRLCIPTLGQTVEGYGLDNIWPKLIGGAGARDRIAILDDIHVVHTRPIGVSFEVDAAIARGNDLQWAYDAPSKVLEYGGILRKPIDDQMT